MTSLEFVVLCDCLTVKNRESLSATVSELFCVCVRVLGRVHMSEHTQLNADLSL